MNEKNTPMILAMAGLAVVLVIMLTKQQQPVVVKQESSGSGGLAGALTGLANLGSAIVNKMQF
jgi:hypothetical protein